MLSVHLLKDSISSRLGGTNTLVAAHKKTVVLPFSFHKAYAWPTGSPAFSRAVLVRVGALNGCVCLWGGRSIAVRAR